MNFVTYFDKHYIPKGLAMLRSLRRQHPDSEVFVLTGDEETRLRVRREDIPVFDLGGLELLYPELAAARQTRSWVEYLWTLTPAVTLFMLDVIGKQEVAYIDADLYFYHPLDELYAETDPYNISAIPHRWTPKYRERLEPNGKYNVSWLRVQMSGQAIEFLAEWMSLCVDCCSASLDDGRLGDQTYLDDLSVKYGIHDVEHLGANLAPWSQEQYQYCIDDDGTIFVDGGTSFAAEDPLLFYHFHEFRHNLQGVTLTRTGYPLHPFVAEWVYPPYETEINMICEELYS